MKLYHGTNVDFDWIDLAKSNRFKDFGQGFYLTNIESQASDWAKKVKLVKKSPTAIINIFDFDYQSTIDAGYKYLCMDEYNKEWLDFILKAGPHRFFLKKLR